MVGLRKFWERFKHELFVSSQGRAQAPQRSIAEMDKGKQVGPHAWPATLTADEQAAVIDLANLCRGWASQVMKLNTISASIQNTWAGGVSAMVAKLAAGDLIPNTSGLAGAQPLNQSDITNMANWAGSYSNPSNPTQGTGAFCSPTIQQVCVKAAGGQNVQ
jgi:hypothetical protein